MRIVIGVPPGGVQDLLARSVAEQLTRLWGQTVIVENRPGATGIIAGTQVAKATPDGYTILLSTANNIGIGARAAEEPDVRPDQGSSSR